MLTTILHLSSIHIINSNFLEPLQCQSKRTQSTDAICNWSREIGLYGQQLSLYGTNSLASWDAAMASDLSEIEKLNFKVSSSKLPGEES